ncbi:hypothetical protein DU80_08645 [Methanosarcina mazei]|uniref:Uncharacterized protein n=1 Tax=Methanosarcina mazei TaxID=2209 RepID=A0A0F8Q3J5_METMZ|nr:hypothetical protein DU40_02240 [Methanosarcina mazei]KKG04460.1 hypothetical protein DU47_15980 [Methanosarcina mazei]KKG08153.1 hypothetical protein DU31_09340 [Methanosarcina mazei]KKG08834.1 hypothetical protein DU34_09400 [Methanosarcina mazei]KKG29403.1 hypothetical protein DU49_00675 [Methanosarcina mazei]
MFVSSSNLISGYCPVTIGQTQEESNIPLPKNEIQNLNMPGKLKIYVAVFSVYKIDVCKYNLYYL